MPAWQVVEVPQHAGDTVETVELRKKFFEKYTDRDECQASLNELARRFWCSLGCQSWDTLS